MKYFVTGINGQLGYDVIRELYKRGYDLIGSDITDYYSGIMGIPESESFSYKKLNITDSDAVFRVMEEVVPDVVIHCAAWTAVDMAEDESNIDIVRAVNIQGTLNIANACKRIGCKMVYMSTDYVFDGTGTKPWKPECKDFNPLNIYGRTKLEGEFAVANTLDKYFIIRTSWVFGLNGNNFIKTMINIGKIHDEVRVVSDQIGTPTYCCDLARIIVDMCETDKYGYYHVTNSEVSDDEAGDIECKQGYISWYDFCCEIYRQYGLRTKITAVTTSEYGLSKAVRPANSRLDKRKLIEKGFEPLPTWQDAIKRYLKEANL